MNTHIITLTVKAPNRIGKSDAIHLIDKLIQIGITDAFETMHDGEGNLADAKDALALRIEFESPKP